MESDQHSLAVINAEVCNLEIALPVTLGLSHPEHGAISGALADVSGRLLTATLLAADGSVEEAQQIALIQLRALESLLSILATTQPQPAKAQELLDKLELICGLLELFTGAEPAL